MSNYLDVLKEGEEIDIRGPTGDIEYLGNGKFKIEGEEHFFSKASLSQDHLHPCSYCIVFQINLIAGGTGLTPHWQLIHAILESRNDKTQVALLDSNKSVGDILMANELQKYADERPEQFKLWHTVSEAPDKWKYDSRQLDEDMMRQHLFPAEEGVATFVSSPCSPFRCAD
jgi:nitrate reductase (NAD(P)H)